MGPSVKFVWFGKRPCFLRVFFPLPFPYRFILKEILKIKKMIQDRAYSVRNFGFISLILQFHYCQEFLFVQTPHIDIERICEDTFSS